MTSERIKELRDVAQRPWFNGPETDSAAVATARDGLDEVLDAIERVRALMREWDGDPLREWCAEAVLAALEGKSE